MATLTENVNRIVDALGDIKEAIIEKGVTPTGKCETFCDAISKIPTGVDTSKDTVTQQYLAEGVTAHNALGVQISGELERHNSLTLTTPMMSYSNGIYLPADADISIDSESINNLIPANIKKDVSILGVTGTADAGIDTSNDTVTANKMLAGTTAHDKNGNAITGSIPTYNDTEWVHITGVNEVPLSVQTGGCYVQNDIGIDIDISDISSENIKRGVSILDVEGDFNGFADLQPTECFFSNQLASGKSQTFDISCNPKFITLATTQYYNGGTYKNRGWVANVDVGLQEAYRYVIAASTRTHEACHMSYVGIDSVDYNNMTLTISNPSAVAASFMIMLYD